MSFDQRHPGGSLEERAAWDAFVRDAFASSVRSGKEWGLAEILDAADQMIERRRTKFPAKPQR